MAEDARESMIERATSSLGSRELAIEWLERPQMGLDRCRPVDMLGTEAGREAVVLLLDRLDGGVYC